MNLKAEEHKNMVKMVCMFSLYGRNIFLHHETLKDIIFMLLLTSVRGQREERGNDEN